MDDYLVEFDDYKEFTVGEFIEILRRKKGRHLNDLKVKDLTYFNNQLITPGHGVYIFKEDDAIILVGKARNVSFTERIAKHLDIRPDAWFNRLMYVKSRQILGDNFKTTLDKTESFKEASLYAFEHYSLILINMENAKQIDQFESILRGTANPLNKYKTKTYSKNLVLKEI
ncbi:hypothetical protein [Myroides guanonis]|uniref:GIY-YIG domain-containing protein n=1 Tax=Myroides guanonis TaxID=1150112 RepID=A0A1I3PNP0_9FLAO|nr:hypothetical protein [Myroides guanonis]SFJ22947.1 hypothetical protein SAMN04487893_104185 [Myroides guanonis]